MSIAIVSEAFWLLDKLKEVGRLTVSGVAATPGWNRLKAWRFLNQLADSGYAERVKVGRKFEFVVGRKCFMREDLSF